MRQTANAHIESMGFKKAKDDRIQWGFRQLMAGLKMDGKWVIVFYYLTLYSFVIENEPCLNKLWQGIYFKLSLASAIAQVAMG